jgi:ABC-type multidrug transport system ATPase subunit
LIEVHRLWKEFPPVAAVKDLEFSIEAGDIRGFIGPNGAGKPTTIEMLATLLEPTSGTARADDG